MGLTRATVSDEDHRFGLFEIPSFGQLSNLTGTHPRRLAKIKFLQSLDPGQPGFFEATLHDASLSFLDFSSQQNFQIPDVTLFLFDRLFSHLLKLPSNRGLPQLLAVLANRRLL
jgi:hypothetical protein